MVSSIRCLRDGMHCRSFRTSSRLRTTGIRFGFFPNGSRGMSSLRPSVVPYRKRRAQTDWLKVLQLTFFSQQMELVLAGVLGSQVLGRAPEVPGELGHVADVALDGLGGIVTQLHVFDQPLSQGSHGGTVGRRKQGQNTICFHPDGRPQSAQDRIIVTTGTTGPRAPRGPIAHVCGRIARQPARGPATRGCKTISGARWALLSQAVNCRGAV